MNIQTINKLMQVLKAFQKLNPQMNLTMAQTLLEVGKGRGVSGRDIEAALDVGNAVASRNLLKMMKDMPDGKKGWDLVDCKEDPTDRRNTLRFPNENLKRFLAHLEHIIED
jgi:DNA-binding MarR family transcriptional regulator